MGVRELIRRMRVYVPTISRPVYPQTFSRDDAEHYQDSWNYRSSREDPRHPQSRIERNSFADARDTHPTLFEYSRAAPRVFPRSVEDREPEHREHEACTQLYAHQGQEPVGVDALESAYSVGSNCLISELP